MKVLVTGGYGFIGSHVAERLHKEGYQVFIIDNLSSGREKNVNFKHKSYGLDVGNKKCDEVFKSNKFDIVIHLAAQVNVNTSMENPQMDADNNILGLVNMLHLSSKYGVTKFIFASSAAVYGDNTSLPLKEEFHADPTSPYGMSKFVGEFYCKKWSELYGLNTLSLRLSNVYGPRQGTMGESGVVSTYMERILDNKEVKVYGDGNQTRDFIYVEDVADAIYRSINSDISGVLNLSTNTENSINKLIELLKSKYPIKKIIYNNGRKGDIVNSRLDNTQAKTLLDWVPLYSFEEGIQKTFRWYYKYFDERKSEISVTAVAPKKGILSKLLPYLENAMGFLLVLFLTSKTLYNADYSMFDFKLLYIILMGVMYGTIQSTISVVLSCIIYIGTSLYMGRDLISLIYDPSSLLQIAIYFLVGLSIGYTIDRKNREIQFKEIKLKDTEDRCTFINEIYNETKSIKEELQNQIVNSEDSFGKIYAITKELESLQPENIFNTSVSVLENVMKSNSISIYIINKTGQFLRLMAKSKNMNLDIPKSIKIRDFPEIKDLITTKEMFVNKSLDMELPMIMAPIVDDNKVVAIVSIQNIEFENLTLYYQNLFHIVVGLISSSLSRAYRYEEATYNERYLNGTSLLNIDSFDKILKSKRKAKNSLKSDYTILRLEKLDLNNEELLYKLGNSIREVDYIGIGKDRNINVLLSNSNKAEGEIVIKRFNRMGVVANIVNEGNEDE